MDEKVRSLLQTAVQAMQMSYSPYSKFPVGAALLCKDGTVIKGCNVENSSYGLSICAERTAIVKAVSEGHKQFQAIAVSTILSTEPASPCGACRQFMREFGVFDVYMTVPDMSKWIKSTTDELLPLAFEPQHLHAATAAMCNP